MSNEKLHDEIMEFYIDDDEVGRRDYPEQWVYGVNLATKMAAEKALNHSPWISAQDRLLEAAFLAKTIIKHEILAEVDMDMQTKTGFAECRYCHADLLVLNKKKNGKPKRYSHIKDCPASLARKWLTNLPEPPDEE